MFNILTQETIVKSEVNPSELIDYVANVMDGGYFQSLFSEEDLENDEHRKEAINFINTLDTNTLRKLIVEANLRESARF